LINYCCNFTELAKFLQKKYLKYDLEHGIVINAAADGLKIGRWKSAARTLKTKQQKCGVTLISYKALSTIMDNVI